MKYAEVSVNSPIAQRRTFTYAVPPGLSIDVGQAVWVPFGDKILQGIVLELSPTAAIETRDIAEVIEPHPLLSPAQVSLARWLSEYYLAPIFDAVALMLPPGFERKAVTFIQPTGKAPDTSSLTEDQRKVLESVQKGKIGLRQLERAAGKTKAQTVVAHLVRLGLVARSYELEPVKVKAKTLPYLQLAVAVDQARQEAARLRQKGAARQADLLDFLAGQAGNVSLAEARQSTGVTRAAADALAGKGLVELRQVEVKREPMAYRNIAPSLPLKLSAAQETAFNAIREALRGPKGSPVFLLHGVTGSGKTEVYLQSLAEAVRLGKRGIVLVPEIALTPQTIERFAARFPGRVAVFHSQLSLGEQFDEWQRIRNGEADVVIGPRSALFTPQPDLGLIVIDEEYEWTYKQSDKSPRYHARAAALKLAELTGAVVVLGSATPDIETFYHARRGDYHLLQLPERIVPSQGAPLPEVEVVDMREELKAGNRSIFSRSLTSAITRAVAAGEQVILFLNRRGAATFIQCRHCGFALRCKRCEMSLSYHAAENSLVCHHCNYRAPVPRACPRCSRPQLSFLGIGTQKLAQETSQAFPAARQLRWDSDTTRQGYSHDEILHRFGNREADILIGTQMVAKGLDFPSVTLVGVVSADTSLNLPDFRAGERTFQLLSQVAGRAGRGVLGGRAIIQTFAPEHYAVQAAARHDYASFYEREIDFRRQLHNPPLTQLALLVYGHSNNTACQREAARMHELLTRERDTRGVADLSLIGPTPAFIQKLRGRFRWQLIVRGQALPAFLATVSFPNGWTVDIDPVSVI